MTKTLMKCANCKVKFKRPARGRAPKYCSQSCRQKAYEKRKLQAEVATVGPLLLLGHDIDEDFRTKDGIKKAVVSILRELGFLPPSAPTKPDLSVVKR